MIVEPDFLTHWKTQMLVDELGDKAAPLFVIALWAHCQQRKSDRFTHLAPNALKAICRYEGEASRLRSALERCGFIEADGEATVVHGWAETNATLVANWVNGKKGGRPRKPTDNPSETQSENGLTQSEPRREEKSGKEGEDEIGEEGIGKSDYPTDFEAWWTVYPLKVAKRAALKAFEAAKKRASVEVLTEAAEAYAASAQGQGEFCPHASTWLNKSRWEDDRSTWGDRRGRASGQRHDPGNNRPVVGWS